MLHQKHQTLNEMQDGERPITWLPLRAPRVANGLIDEHRGILKERDRCLGHVEDAYVEPTGAPRTVPPGGTVLPARPCAAPS